MQWIQILKIQVTNSPEITSTSDYNRKWGTGIMWDHDKSNLILAGIIQSGWQCFKSLSTKAYSRALAKKRTAIFWVITQHVVVISYWCLCCIITQKIATLIHFVAAAWNHAQHSPSFMLDYKEGRILRFWPTDVLPYIRVKMHCRKRIFHILYVGTTTNSEHCGRKPYGCSCNILPRHTRYKIVRKKTQNS